MNKLLTEYYAARKIHDEKLAQLDQKVEFIVNAILKAFKSKIKQTWWDYDYGNSDHRPLPKAIDKNSEYFNLCIYYVPRFKHSSNDYNKGFPIKFFYMTEEEIIDHIQKEIEQDKLNAQPELEKN